MSNRNKKQSKITFVVCVQIKFLQKRKWIC